MPIFLRAMLILLAVCLASNAFAANVQWNELAFDGDSSWDGMGRRNYWWEMPYFELQAILGSQALQLTATYGNFMEYAYTVTQADVGDVVNPEYMSNPQQKFHYVVSKGDDTEICEPITVSRGDTFYLAYSVAFGDLNTGEPPDPRMPSVWGWIELYATEEGELIKLFDVQSWGDPITVGATPEPVSGLLLLVGGALLALRRRRNLV
jgi:hypothetical protein